MPNKILLINPNNEFSVTEISTGDDIKLVDPESVVLMGDGGQKLTITLGRHGFEVSYKYPGQREGTQVFEFRDGEVIRVDRV